MLIYYGKEFNTRNYQGKFLGLRIGGENKRWLSLIDQAKSMLIIQFEKEY
jgi:hypothetical protein